MVELILFDIDGTLITQPGLVRSCMTSAFEAAFQTRWELLNDFPMSGKTDTQVIREQLLLFGLDNAVIERRLPEICRYYTLMIRDNIGRFNVRPCAGILALLDALEDQKNITLGLLTGTLENIVEIKLSAAGINRDLFRIGAYGSDHADRAQLARIAIARASEQCGCQIDPSAILIIGDTPADIACARAVNAKAVAVATGIYPCDELILHNPDYLFSDLSDLNAILNILA